MLEGIAYRERKTVTHKKAELRLLLGAQMEEGWTLLHGKESDQELIYQWFKRTLALIDAGLGSAEKHSFMLAFVPEGVDRGSVGREHLEALEGSLIRLGELVSRLETIPPRDSFDPKRW